MYGQMVAALPSLDDISKITSPVDRACRLCGLARQYGTLPPSYAAARRGALIEALEDRSRKITWLAQRVGLTPSRISKIVNDA